MVHELQQYAEVYDRLDDLDSPKSRSKLCAGVFTGKSGRVFDHPWLRDWGIEGRWDKGWITSRRLGGGMRIWHFRRWGCLEFSSESSTLRHVLGPIDSESALFRSSSRRAQTSSLDANQGSLPLEFVHEVVLCRGHWHVLSMFPGPASLDFHPGFAEHVRIWRQVVFCEWASGVSVRLASPSFPRPLFYPLPHPGRNQPH